VSEPSRIVLAMAAQVAVARELEDEPEADWENAVQIRLMELDVDPGNDADLGSSKAAGV
jgi:hypothetical protein